MTTPTLRPYPNFNPDGDCAKLRKAVRGWGTDENGIIEVLAHRTSEQRVQIVEQYATLYGQNLIGKLRSGLSGNLKHIVEAMCIKLEEYYARELHEAMRGAGTDEDVLIEILVSCSNAQMRQIKEIYPKLFSGRDLLKDLANDTSGHCKRILISLAQGNRDENPYVDSNVVNEDVEALYQAGEGRLGTDESTFNRILAARSKPHIRALMNRKAKNSDLERALIKEMSGDLLRSFMALVRCIRNEPLFFAKELYKSIKGAGTRDHSLIRIVVTRCEVDMVDIKREYYDAYGRTLTADISSDTSGDYKRMLLALVA